MLPENDRRIRETFAKLSEDYNAGRIDEPAMAQALEDECLSGWEALVDQLEAVQVPAAVPIREHYELVLEYARLRLAAYTALSEAFRLNDLDRVEKFYRLYQEGDEVLNEINSKYKGLP